MPQPTVSDVHVNRPLTNFSVLIMQNSSDFIAQTVFPTRIVDFASDIYTVYTQNDWFRDEAKVWAANSESAGSGYNIDNTNTYSCIPYGFHKDVSDRIRRNNKNTYNLDKEAAMFVTNTLLLRREIDWASAYFAASLGWKDYTGVASSPSTDEFIQWDDYASSDPAKDIRIGKMYVKSITGKKPNVLVLDEQVFEVLKLHPDLTDRFKYTTADSITTDMMARFFEVERVVIAGAIKATNIEGATAAYSFITSKGALLVYVDMNAGVLSPTAGVNFIWRNITGGVNSPIVTWKYRMEHLKADRIEGEIDFDHKITAASLGAFFATAIS